MFFEYNQRIAIGACTEREGIAVLPVMLLIGSIIIEIAIVGGILAFFSSTSNLAIRASQEALFTARAGVEDALIKIVRDKNYPAGSFTISVNSGVATTTASTSISVIDIPLTGQRTIIATSTVFRRTKTVRAVVNVDSVTGKITIVSFEEITN